MKKLLILFVTAFLLINCSDTKDSESKKTDENSTEKKDDKKTNVKKPDTTGKVVLHEHFDDVKPEDITTEDKSGWPEARKTEVLKMCMEDVGEESKEAKAYCNCQLDNAMKIFASYKEAMTTFNKTEDELTEAEWQKLTQMEETDGNCMEQNYSEDDMDNEDEKDGM